MSRFEPDYLYTPSTDVPADARVLVEATGGTLGFAPEVIGA